MQNLTSFAFIVLLFAAACTSPNLPNSQWRGINRDGIYPETNLMKSWPVDGPRLLWSSEEIGIGYSSPVVSGKQLFINGEIDSIAHLFAFDLYGNLKWKVKNSREFFGEGYSANFPGARSTPTIYDGKVYISSGLGRIACLEASSGKEIWATDMVNDLGGKINMFGYSESLLVDEKYVYCYPGGAESNIVALDRLIGKPVWTSKAMGDGVSFCSPILIKLQERKLLVTLSREYLLGLDAQTGELLWSHKEDSVKYEGEHCNTPIFDKGFIYCISGDEKGNGAYKIALSADGKHIKEVWRNNRVLNAIGGFVKIDDHIFATSNDNKLKCIDSQTGAVLDSIKGLRGSIIYADNHLYCYSDNGNVNLIKHTGSKMEVVSKFRIGKGAKEHFAHPVIANGVLYIRHGNALMAYGVSE